MDHPGLGGSREVEGLRLLSPFFLWRYVILWFKSLGKVFTEPKVPASQKTILKDSIIAEDHEVSTPQFSQNENSEGLHGVLIRENAIIIEIDPGLLVILGNEVLPPSAQGLYLDRLQWSTAIFSVA